MTINPLTLLDSILSDYASPKTRRLIHSLLLLGAVLVTLYLSVEGNWREAIVALAAAIYAGANKANTGSEADDGVYDGVYDDEDGSVVYENPDSAPAPYNPSEAPHDDFGYGPNEVDEPRNL